jgi:hypothetical protein
VFEFCVFLRTRRYGVDVDCGVGRGSGEQCHIRREFEGRDAAGMRSREDCERDEIDKSLRF